MTITVDGQPAWTVILVGHPLVLPMMEQLPHVDELLAIKSFLRPLTADETRHYVEHCLRQAGATDSIFTPEALQRAADLSGGIPRRINRLCDLALLVAYAEKSPRVDAHHVEAVFDELCGIPAQ
jgi:general secretion pathway protein A